MHWLCIRVNALVMHSREHTGYVCIDVNALVMNSRERSGYEFERVNAVVNVLNVHAHIISQKNPFPSPITLVLASIDGVSVRDIALQAPAPRKAGIALLAARIGPTGIARARRSSSGEVSSAADADGAADRCAVDCCVGRRCVNFSNNFLFSALY